MLNEKFEESFAEFLAGNDYDQAEGYLFSVARLAFAAGWEAAGGSSTGLEQEFAVVIRGGEL